jgi:two-component system OmpR family sensor kinase
MAALLLFFSLILYQYINYSVDKELLSSLNKHAKYIFATYPDVKEGIEENGELLRKTLHIDAKIIYLPDANYQSTHIHKYKKDKEYFFELHFPYNFQQQSYLSISADITKQKKVQQQVYKSIIFINLLSMGLIILYAYFLSGMLISPVRVLSAKLSKRDENMMEPLDTTELPKEFEPLAQSINRLMIRIQNFVKYKKELFIGAAHELKTPLAVMKTKTQVTLMKRKTTKESLTEALEQNIISIDEMNKIVSSILEFGRAEGAQFEKPIDIDVIEFLKKRAEDFKILADANQQQFEYELTPDHLTLHIQPLLLIQVVQNFIQNALKFTPNEKKVLLKSYLLDGNLVIEVIDEGEGIDETKDLFAPFIRSQKSNGTGLGLFLAKSASDAMGAVISIKNRTDSSGAIASLVLPKYPFCMI